MLLLDLKRALYDAVTETVPESKVAVAFSGGVDSSALAKICKDLGKEIRLLTVGFPGSQDVEFSKVIAGKIGLRQDIAELDNQDFQASLRNVRRLIKCENTSHIENCVAYHYISKLAKQTGFGVVLSANGCDELFCGYNGYRAVYGGGDAQIMRYMEDKIANEFALMEEIALVVAQAHVKVRQPFLSLKFIEFAKTIPIDQKIKGADDMMRKHVLRQVALSIGVPEESAMRPKKALQYGTSIHKHFKKAQSGG